MTTAGTRLSRIAVLLAASVLGLTGCDDSTRDEPAAPQQGTATSAESGPADPVRTERDNAPIGPPIEQLDDMNVQVGERRLLPMDTHCGIWPYLQLNGGYWKLAETPVPFPETGAGDRIPADWPTTDAGSVAGYVGLSTDGTIRYSLPDGTVLAVYEAAEPPPTQGGCA